MTSGPTPNDPTPGVIPPAEVPPPPGRDAAARAGVWPLVILAGFAARLAIAAVSYGNNDAPTFLDFARQVRDQGLIQTYRQTLTFNHPPLPGLWAAAAVRAADAAVGPDSPAVQSVFCFVFKLPWVAADAGSAWLLYRIWARRGGPAAGWRAAGLYSVALAPLLVGAYQCNSDTAYAMLSLLSAYLLADRRRPLAAGLALAAAVNVKLVPVLLALPLVLPLLDGPRRRDGYRFLAGLSAGALPFLPLLLAAGPAFYRNAIAYRSYTERWGLMLPFTWGSPYLPGDDHPLLLAYWEFGRTLVLALVLAWAVAATKLRRWDAYAVAAATYAIFLVFAPGFQPQYTAMVAPLLFAVGLRVGAAYSTAAGLCLFTTYYLLWDGTLPAYSPFDTYLPRPAAAWGAVAWAVLAYFLYRTVRRPAGGGEPSPGRAPARAAAAAAN